MSLISRLLRCSATPTGRRVLFAVTTVAAVIVACNPQLLPLLPVIDAVGLDVLVLLLGAQVMATAPWLRDHATRGARQACRVLAALLAGAIGGYLRQLVFGIARGTVVIGRPA
ncbi:hypothetical protein [Stenotrophomonas tumulicola]|uniref:Uncharacterized protein n=1 Tax=Stenotrophomonas tumulicola TaxID=1685415 RepID=A0A7W3FIK9_9GAMM|nr:hypothetical protein [Stenotrophomonas tumulicola]MBA8680208.1 hypothetical protein [Stenotrophomonas tumulicola]